MRKVTIFVSGFFLLGAPAGFSQSAGAVTTLNVGGSGRMTFGANQLPIPALTGAPYYGEQTQEQVQTLVDGTHITRSMGTVKTWRDSQGRIRTERPMMMGNPNLANPADTPVIIEISDPVAGVRYALDPQNKVAHRTTAAPAGTPMVRSNLPAGTLPNRLGAQVTLTSPPPPPASVATGVVGATVPNQANSSRPQFSSESLGTQVIEGILVEGHRQTTTFPVGSQGNDRPIVVTSESWMSPELKTLILSKTTDPRSGEHTTKLTNISRAEPDPALFQPPADYTVVDETGPFSIQFSH